MKFEKQTVYRVAGIGMIVGAFFAAAKGLGGILAIVFIIATTDFFSEFGPTEGDKLVNAVWSNHLSSSVRGVTSFLILFFGGRWMLRGPRILDRWIAESDDGGIEDTKNTSEQGEEADAGNAP